MSDLNFSWRRVGLLLKREWVVNGRLCLWVLLTYIAGLAFDLMVRTSLLTVNIRAIRFLWYPKLNSESFTTYSEYSGLWILVFLGIFSCIAFLEFTTASKLQFYYAFPATLFEKWLSKLLVYAIILSIICLFLYYFLFNIILLYKGWDPSSIRWMMMKDFQSDIAIVYVLVYIMIFFSVLFAIRYVRYIPIKVAIILFGILYLGQLIRNAVLSSITGGAGLRSDNFWHSYIKGYNLLDHHLFTVILWLGLIGLLIASYFSLKEKEV